MASLKSAPETILEIAKIIAKSPENLEQLKQYPHLFVKMPIEIDPLEIDEEADPDEISDGDVRSKHPGVVGNCDFLFSKHFFASLPLNLLADNSTGY
jgi:hypothetical protein